MAGDDFKNKVDEAIKHIAATDPNGHNQICTNWIMITEWADFEGTRYLHTLSSDSMTPWLAQGMLSYAEAYDYGTEDEEDDDE